MGNLHTKERIEPLIALSVVAFTYTVPCVIFQLLNDETILIIPKKLHTYTYYWTRNIY